MEISEAAKAKGVHAVDAPVSGGDVGAKEARLSIMIGGDDGRGRRAQPLFEAMGKTIVHQGRPGPGQHTKMVNQILIATNMIGVCEALLYGYKAGLDLNTVLQSVGSGAAGSMVAERTSARGSSPATSSPGFFVEHFIKDMGIALAEVEADEPLPAGPGPRQPALPGGRGPGLRPQGDACPGVGPRPDRRD